MSFNLNIVKKMVGQSARVKCVDIHPTEPWILASLFTGSVQVWNVFSQTVIKTFEVSDSQPVRAAKFIARNDWVVTGSDDLAITVLNYNTQERVHKFKAHEDFIRCLAVHPSKSLLISGGDDQIIKLWNWDLNWELIRQFIGHNHYVMSVLFCPHDENCFASASLDTNLKVWHLDHSDSQFTLEGHEKAINCVDFCHFDGKLYLVSGSDDTSIKIWDFSTRSCVQTLKAHESNVNTVCSHPKLPIILSASDDKTVKIWAANSYELLKTLNYKMERAWTIGAFQNSNMAVIGYDEGLIALNLNIVEPGFDNDLIAKFEHD